MLSRDVDMQLWTMLLEHRSDMPQALVREQHAEETMVFEEFRLASLDMPKGSPTPMFVGGHCNACFESSSQVLDGGRPG
jgi:hypothetical protein